MTRASLPTSGIHGKYLTVQIGNEAYGIAVTKVRDIIRLQKITAVPNLPTYVKGVINLRGRVIPVVDLRIKFGLTAEYAARTCIVVVQVVPAGHAPLQMGLIVDRVEEVVTLSEDQIEPTPDFGIAVDTSSILGMAKVNSEVKTLLNIDRVVGAEVLPAIAAGVRQPIPFQDNGSNPEDSSERL